MTEAIFQAPKRRARVYDSYEAPFPVLCSGDETEPQEHRVYRAEIVNLNVIVRDPNDIQALYGKGYFGKGILSRSRPQHSISHEWNSVSGRCLPVISPSKYQQHVCWARDVLLSQGMDEDMVSDMLEKCMHPEQLWERSEEEEGENGTFSPENNGQTGAAAAESEGQDVRRQGDPRYDPLAELHPCEAEPTDGEALASTRCSRHDDWLRHCGCQPQASVLPATTREGVEHQGPAASSGYEYVLVEEEEDEESARAELSDRSSTKRLVCRMNPFRIIEYLQLTLEEAFFLAYALGCLTVYCHEDPLSIAQLWELLCSVQPSFDTTYAAYHYFRSKGWVPKVGLKYGTDLLLYRKGPPFYHASYSVVVEKADDSFQGSSLHPFTWRSLATLCRITSNVAKELMLCYVIRPSDMTTEDLCSPECIKRMKVQEMIVSRWVSSRERTEQEEM